MNPKTGHRRPVVYVWRTNGTTNKEAAVELSVTSGDDIFLLEHAAQRLLLIVPRAIPGEGGGGGGVECLLGHRRRVAAKSPEEKCRRSTISCTRNSDRGSATGAVVTRRALNEIANSGYGNSKKRHYLLAGIVRAGWDLREAAMPTTP